MSLTPTQAQLLAQCMSTQGQALLQGIGGPGQDVPKPGAALSVPQNLAQTVGIPGQTALGPKKAGIVRVGIAEPKVQIGQGNSGLNVAEPIRTAIIQYLAGPLQEVIPLAAMIPSQVDAEAKAKECDYVLQSAFSQKTHNSGMGFLQKVGPLASLAPMLIPGAGAIGAIAGAAAGTGVASVAGMVKPGSEVTFEYKLMATGNNDPVVANAETVKIKGNGEDVISSLVEHAATAILAEVTKKK
jgi:hypothetical protein